MNKWSLVFTAWILSVLATAGSLFFSEVMSYPPCALCWYQRIAMYPLVLILLPAVLNFEKSVLKYSFPITLLGWLIAVYHNFVYFGVIPETLSPCTMGVSCKAKFFQLLGFVDIPQLSLLAFSLVLLTLLLLRKASNHE